MKEILMKPSELYLPKKAKVDMETPEQNIHRILWPNPKSLFKIMDVPSTFLLKAEEEQPQNETLLNARNILFQKQVVKDVQERESN